MTDQNSSDDQPTAEQPATGWTAGAPAAPSGGSVPNATPGEGTTGSAGWNAAQGGWQAPAAPSAWGQPSGELPAWQQPTPYQGADAGYAGYAAPGQGADAGYAAPQQGTPGSWAYDTAAYGTAAGYPGTAPGYPGTPGEPPAGTGAGKSAGRPKSRIGLILASAALVGLVAGGVGGYLGSQYASDSGSSTVSLPQVSGELSSRPADSIAGIAAQVTPAVVSIEVTSSEGSGTGSGLVIRKDGYILTNNHVVESAASGGEITVNFSDDSSLPATIVGRDTSYDLAVIKVDATDLPTVTLGDSDAVVVGDTVIAVGSPLGLEGTVTSGIISALNRPVKAGGSGETSFINAIQTDAAINPGNSGGALVNADGQVVGINSAIATMGDGSSQSGSIGLGFAIPINQAKRIAEELISTGTSTKPIIGVQLDTSYTGDGARVQSVTDGSPAQKAGFEAGDVIVKFDGKTVDDATSLIVDVRSKNPGDEVTITVDRNGSTQDLTVTLGSDSSTQ